MQMRRLNPDLDMHMHMDMDKNLDMGGFGIDS